MRYLFLLILSLTSGASVFAQDKKASPCDSTVYVANTMTPNGDGINEMLIPVFESRSPHEFTFVIFNRWGQEVFRTSDLRNGWTGGKENEGVYYWTLKYRYEKDGEEFSCNGNVTLLK